MVTEGMKGGGVGVGGGGGGGGGRVGVVAVHDQDDVGDGMQCIDHPYRNKQGGICAFCLQEKLGKLVSSSFPLPPVRPSSASSSSSPSFRSDVINGSYNAATAAAAATSSVQRPMSTKSSNGGGTTISDYQYYSNDQHFSGRARGIPFLLARKKKKYSVADHHHRDHPNRAADIVFTRSMSTTTPRRAQFMDTAHNDEDCSPGKRGGGFWSFLYHSSSTKSHVSKKTEKTITAATAASVTVASMVKENDRLFNRSSLGKNGAILEDKDIVSANSVSASGSSFERKVSRSRSVGCGSRSFSGDFFERISTGLGDCTLRRVESQRECGKHRTGMAAGTSTAPPPPQCMKERVKCGGLFGGFMTITSSTSSSSSSSSYWVPSSAHETGTGGAQLAHGRSKSWSWAFASPARAFSKPSSSSKGAKRSIIIRESSDKNTTPNLADIPSLLTVGG